MRDSQAGLPHPPNPLSKSARGSRIWRIEPKIGWVLGKIAMEAGVADVGDKF